MFSNSNLTHNLTRVINCRRETPPQICLCIQFLDCLTRSAMLEVSLYCMWCSSHFSSYRGLPFHRKYKGQVLALLLHKLNRVRIPEKYVLMCKGPFCTPRSVIKNMTIKTRPNSEELADCMKALSENKVGEF